MKMIKELGLRFIIACMALYILNLVLSPFGLVVPINVITIAILVILKIWGLVIIILGVWFLTKR